MKKLALTLAIILGIALGASAQNGGLFGKGPSRDMDYEYGTREGEGPMINLPGSHGTTNDESAPLGGGIALLTGLGAAYLVAKKRKNAQRGAMMVLLALLLALTTQAWAAEGITCSAGDVGKVLCTDGSIYDNVSAAEADGKTAVAMIAYLDTKNNKGLALALADEGQMNWNTAISTCSAKTPTVTGGTWKLATKDEWSNMITAAGSYTALRDGFSSVGGTNMQSVFYWSSTSVDEGSAWGYNFYGGGWSNDYKYQDYYVRACLAFDFTAPVWPTQGAGTVDDPYIISSAEDWNDFAYNVRIGRSYSGQYVKLTSDISVSTMAGAYQTDDNCQPFSGTFDGDGHTLTINLNNQSRFAAPFKCVSGATIKNLRTAGTIDGTGNADGKLLAGIIGVSFGNTTITGCRSSVTLTTDFGEDAALAGLVAGTKGGSLTIAGCAFDGEMTGGSNTRCAGIAGYEYAATTTTISDCLFIPATLTISTADDSYTKTISRDADATITNCYYTQTLGAAQGTVAVASTTAPANLGNLVQDYGMVKAYANGLLFGGMYYADLSTYNGADNWDVVYRLTQTTSANWTALSAGSTTGWTIGSAGNTTYYYATGNLSFTNSNDGGSGLTILGTVYLYIPKGVTVTCTGHNASGTTGAGAGVELAAGNTLYLLGGGTINATGGNAANGTNGSNGDNSNFEYNHYCQPGSGGAGGNGGGGAGAGIGTHGGNGGNGGAGGAANRDKAEGTNLGVAGSAGSAGATAGSMGTLYVNQIMGISVNVTGGSAGTGGTGGNRGYNAVEDPGHQYSASGGGGGGAGGGGGFANNIGTGGPGGGGGGGGAAGNSAWRSSYYPDVFFKVGAGGGSGGQNADGTYAANGVTSELTSPYDAEYKGGLTLNEYHMNYYEEGNGKASGGGSGSCGGASQSGAAVTINVVLDDLINGSGTEDTPYTISSTADWDVFALLVSNGYNFSGEYVKLTADISVTTPVGYRVSDSDNKPFSGTFLGDGNTITVTLDDDGNQGLAPFRYINGATIKDLKVAGTIASSQYHTSGLVGFANGTNTIEDCLVTATLNITSNYAGGIIGHGLNSITTIRGCAFTGTINGVDGNRGNIGGIWGWSSSGTPTLVNCLEAGTYTNIASMHPMGLQSASGTINNCYYINPQVGSPANVCTVSGAAPGNARTIAGYGEGNDKWAFIASPLTANTDPTTVQNLISASEYDLYQLNPGTMMWENYKQHEGNAASGFSLENGRGYLYATQSEQAIKFSGANASAYNLDNTKEVTLQQGFNLVGNPFPRAAYINRSYYTLNSDGSAVSTTPSTEYIPPCHAVVVEATNSESLTFSTKPLAQQSTGNNGGLQIALSQTVATRGGAEAKTIDNAIVTFNEGMELGKFYFGTQDANVYIPQDGKDYAVAYSSGVGEVPVNFKANRNGEYSLTINPEGVEMAYLHLIDNLAGTDVDLLQTPSYTFTARNDDYESRFRLVFVANDADLGGEGNDDFAFISNGQLIITSEGTLQVVDMMGRVISTEVINGTSSKAINAKAGVYVLRLMNGENVKTQKIVVR